MAKVSNERERFSSRLQQSLLNARHSPDSPTELARDFNARFSGRPITVHAARKWLVSEAIPTQDKMRVLADWLAVPIEWLRFGGNENEPGSPNLSAGDGTPDPSLIADLQLLDEQHREIAREVIRILIRISRHKEKQPDTQSKGIASQRN
ncbi:MAG: hypothetical protein JWQ23_3288 [Herminiimonas sp.]|nr:hypothetical protein [Herminiimonas sp.]